MGMDVSYPVGTAPDQHSPLTRFLPPLDEGSVRRAIAERGWEGRLILDPFGVSPRLVLEAAQSGAAVVAAVNNPITRFVLEHTLVPFNLNELQATLARLAATPKNGGRLELFLLDLYQTECSKCGAPVIADYFVWDRDLDRPTHKVFSCERCSFSGEALTNAADWNLAESFTQRGLHHAMALEQVATQGDPDREHAQAALSVYPARALYALITLMTKVAQMSWEPKLYAAAQALLLSAFDQSNALWGYPEGRSRPRQLSASPRYREINVWRALEAAVRIWAKDDPGIKFQKWTDGQLPDPGDVAVFPGPLRDLMKTFPKDSGAVVFTILPRPNQAFWTLCALWAAWLWGRDSAASIRMALRRRRYDWAWHASALRTVLSKLHTWYAGDQALLAFLPEAEPGFTAATLASLDGVGFRLAACAIRGDEGQAFFQWMKSDGDQPEVPVEISPPVLIEAVRDYLQQRGEPATFPLVHAAVWCHLAMNHQLAHLWEDEDTHPLSLVGEVLQQAISDRRHFQHLGRGTELESGQYWLVDAENAATPLADRVEKLVVEILRSRDGISAVELDQCVCDSLPGLLTPDRRLVHACIQSYALEQDEIGLWFLREEDQPDIRRADSEEIKQLLVELGSRLGFAVQQEETITWLDAQEAPVYTFVVMATATIGTALQTYADRSFTFVMPGGRAALVTEKARRDYRLRALLEDGLRVVKFRHVRRLAGEATLTEANLAERIAIDPPGYHDPQLPLL
jgi:hypothetical protein